MKKSGQGFARPFLRHDAKLLTFSKLRGVEMISQNDLKNVLSYDKNSGIFVWKASTSNVIKAGSVAGSTKKQRIYIKVFGARYSAHRLAWFYVYGYFPQKQIDHIDGNPSNNAIGNLREATNGQNGQNKKKARKDCVSMLAGSHYVKRRDAYESRITVDGKKIYLGYFKSAEDAHNCYIQAKRKLHEFCTI